MRQNLHLMESERNDGYNCIHNLASKVQSARIGYDAIALLLNTKITLAKSILWEEDLLWQVEGR